MHPILIHTEWLPVPTYGLFYLASFLAGIFTAAYLNRRRGIPFSRTVDATFLMAICGEIGAHVTFAIIEWDRILAGDISLEQFVFAGRVVMGGVTAGVLFIVWYLRKMRMPVLDFLDGVFTGLALGMGIGRVGCLMAGCCFGGETDLWWGITFTHPLAHFMSGTPLNVPLHPTQILSSLSGFALFALLLWLHGRPAWRGRLTGVYLVGQGVLRFGIEFLRDDPRGAVLGLATSQWISIGFVAVGAAILRYAAHRWPAPYVPEPATPVSQDAGGAGHEPIEGVPPAPADPTERSE